MINEFTFGKTLYFRESLEEQLKDGVIEFYELPEEYKLDARMIKCALKLNKENYFDIPDSIRGKDWADYVMKKIDEDVPLIENYENNSEYLNAQKGRIEFIERVLEDKNVAKNATVNCTAVKLISDICYSLCKDIDAEKRADFAEGAICVIREIREEYNTFDGKHLNSSKETNMVEKACNIGLNDIERLYLGIELGLEERVK